MPQHRGIETPINPAHAINAEAQRIVAVSASDWLAQHQDSELPATFEADESHAQPLHDEIRSARGTRSRDLGMTAVYGRRAAEEDLRTFDSKPVSSRELTEISPTSSKEPDTSLPQSQPGYIERSISPRAVSAPRPVRRVQKPTPAAPSRFRIPKRY